MSYTPPAYTAANTSFQGSAAYTPPAYNAANASFAPTITNIEMVVTCVSASGVPRATGSQQVAWAAAVSAAGTPFVTSFAGLSANVLGTQLVGVPVVHILQQIGWVEAVAVAGMPAVSIVQQVGLITGTGLTGNPSVVGLQQVALAIGAPAIGTPATLSRTGFLALAQPLPALGIPQGTASSGYRLLAQPLPSLGTPRVFAWSLPAPAAIIPPGVTLYYCKITGAADGLADALLPISNFSVRHRQATASYYNVTIPSFAYVAALAARTHGEIVLWSERAGVTEELMRGALGDVSVARGPNSQSISISGNASRAATPSFTYIITEALYTSTTFAGDTRLRIEPRAAIRPGDYVRYQELNFAVGEVSWSVAVSAGGMAVTMEVASLPVA